MTERLLKRIDGRVPFKSSAWKGRVKLLSQKMFTWAHGYIGTVRFFKNMIFLSICILIAIPSILAVKYYQDAASLLPDTEASVPTFAPDADEMIENAAGETEDTEKTEAANPSADAGALAVETCDAPSYQALYPDFYAPQPYGATERIEGMAFLTFDDGPSPQTDEILAILAEQDIKATFFVVGCNEMGDEQRLRDIVAQGHTIGMHSYTHDYEKVYASVEDFLAEFYAVFQEIRDITGVTPTVFRCPGGSINGYNSGFYQEMFSEMIRRGFVPFDWNVSSDDAVGERKSAAQLTENVMTEIKGKTRAFILFHDSADKVQSVKALPAVIAQTRELGFEFAAITPKTMPVIFSYN